MTRCRVAAATPSALQWCSARSALAASLLTAAVLAAAAAPDVPGRSGVAGVTEQTASWNYAAKAATVAFSADTARVAHSRSSAASTSLRWVRPW